MVKKLKKEEKKELHFIYACVTVCVCAGLIEELNKEVGQLGRQESVASASDSQYI